MTSEQRKALIQELIEADYQNALNDYRFFHWIMHDGHKGYTNMTNDELLELKHG